MSKRVSSVDLSFKLGISVMKFHFNIEIHELASPIQHSLNSYQRTSGSNVDPSITHLPNIASFLSKYFLHILSFLPKPLYSFLLELTKFSYSQ